MAQLSTIRTNVTNNWPSGFSSSFSSYLTTTTGGQVDTFINDTQKWVCSGSLYLPDGRHIIHGFSWLKREVTASTVDEQRRYALPDNTNGGDYFKNEITLELIDANSYRKELTHKEKRDIEHDPDYRDTTGKGTPQCYCIDDWDIWLYPLPDHASNSNSAWTINLEYYAYMDDMTADTDTNHITNRWPEILEYGATALSFRYAKDFEQEAYWENRKIQTMLEMIKVDQALEHSGVEQPMMPTDNCALGAEGPGMPDFFYYDDKIYT